MRNPDPHHLMELQVICMGFDQLDVNSVDWLDVRAFRYLGPARQTFHSVLDLVKSTSQDCMPHVLAAAFSVSTNMGLCVSHAVWHSQLEACPHLTDRILHGDSARGPVLSTGHSWALDPRGGVVFTTTIGIRTLNCSWLPGPTGRVEHRDETIRSNNF